MIKSRCSICLSLMLLFAIANEGLAQDLTILKPTEVKFQEAYTTTIPLRYMELIPSKGKTNWKNGVVPNKGLPVRHQKMLNQKSIQPDPVVQKIYNQAPPDNKAVVQNFDGISNTYGVAPPDTQGDVGLNHYIQMVNNGFQIFDKSGNAVTSPTSLSTLWNNLPGPWNGTNNGDPIVLYDETENRWMLSQFSMPNYPNGTFYELIAVSATSDPMGAYHVYAYSFVDMPDYPKFGIWHDGFYMSINRFASGTLNYAGTGAVAFEKSQMLLGMPAQMIYFTFSSTSDPWSFLPADLDGPAPSTVLPNYFTYVDFWSGTDRLRTYYFTTNWVTPASSTFVGPYDVNVASINNTFTTDIVQPGTSQTLDPLETRLMYRLQFRDFGTYQVMLANQTVNVGSNRAGIRWYEMRNYGAGWALFQQGTYAPSDSHSRWMASIAMNRNGDIALGYSISSGSLSPSIRYTGRLSTDPSGSMGQPEGTIITGLGYQSGTLRWGDYSCMSVDPEDDYTFWYTQEYVNPGGSFAWKTRVASFQFGSLPTADVWTGNTSNLWNDPNNWSDGTAPYRSDDVIINATPSPANWPTIMGDLATGLSINDLTINGSANITVLGDLEISKGTSVINSGSSQIFVHGDWVNNGTFIPGTGSVILQGSLPSVMKSEQTSSFERSTIFESNNGSTSNYFDIVSNSNVITINAFDISCNTTSLVTVEIWYRTDTYVGNTGSGAGWMPLGSPKVVTGQGSDKATNVIPDLPLIIPAGSTYGVFISCYSGTSGYIRYTNGAFTFFDPNLTINTGAGSNGTQPGTGTIYSPRSWNGTIYYSIDSNPVLSFYNLTIDKTNTEVTALCDVSVINDLTVQPLAYFTNGPGKQLSIGNDFTLANSSGRTGSFIDNGTLTVTGTTTVEKEYIDGRWHFMSSPVSTGYSALFTGIYLKYWNEPTYSWEYIIALDSLLRIGKGYEVWSTLGNPTIGYTGGGLNSGAVSPTLKATDVNGGGFSPTEGWNLVGNPYASAMDLGNSGNPIPGYTWTNLDNTTYTWNGVNYATYNPYTGIAQNGGSRYVPAMQGFFVKANNTTPILQFPLSARVHSTKANFKNKTTLAFIRLTGQANGYANDFIFGEYENALPGYDGQFDAYHLEGIEESPQLYQITDNKKLAVNLISDILPTTQIALGYIPGSQGLHTIELSETQGLTGISHIILEDLLEGVLTNLLQEPVYDFVASPGDEEHRFNLYFDEITTGIEKPAELLYSIVADEDNIYIELNKPVTGTIQIYNLLGQPLANVFLRQQQNVSIPSEMPVGLYVITGNFSDSSFKRKLILK